MNKIHSFYRSAKEKAEQLAVGGVLAIASGIASATVDVAEIKATYTEIAAVGAAVFGAYVCVKAVKLVRRAL